MPPPYHPTSFSREHLAPQIESSIVEGKVLIQEILKHNALAPFDNTRSLSACGPFGGFFFPSLCSILKMLRDYKA